jgi:carboxylate-amine ligase
VEGAALISGDSESKPDAYVDLFDSVEPFTVGLEEEVMLVEPNTLVLCECARTFVDRLADDARFKLEMPAAQLELVTASHAGVPDAIAELADARRVLWDAGEGLARPLAAGCHPSSSGEGVLNRSSRYAHTIAEYGTLARRQLVCALQVHVAVGGARRTLTVYNALREYLPLLAALAANAPIYEGRDTGLASVRPKISELLPRQGIPPAFPSWDALTEELRWGAAAGSLPDVGSWWWELRPHLRFGTLELRVPDTQTTLAEAAAVAAVGQALVALLAERDEVPSPVPTWRIEENRWSACRHGLEGSMADLRSGKRRATRDLLDDLLNELEPVAQGLGAGAAMYHARSLIERNGSTRQRAVFAEEGAAGLLRWLVQRYMDAVP